MRVLNRVKLGMFCVAFAAAIAAAQPMGPAPSVGAEPTGVPFDERTPRERQPLGQPGAVRPVTETDRSEKQSTHAIGETGMAGSAIAAAGVSGLIVVLGILVRMVMRKRGGLMSALGAGGRAPSGLIEILARYPVGRQSTLIVLKIDRRVLLLNQIAGRGGGMSVLTEFTDPEEVASILLRTRDETETRAAARFQDILTGAGEPYAIAVTGRDAATEGGAIQSLRRHLSFLAGGAAKGAA